MANIHLESKLNNVLLHPIPLETMWMAKATRNLNLLEKLLFKILHKILLYDITDMLHITLCDRLDFMIAIDFKCYFNTPTLLAKRGLQIA